MNKKILFAKIKKIRLTKVINKFVYLFLFLFLSFIITYIYFPYNKLKKPIEKLFYNQTGLKMKINSVHNSFPFNITLSSIKIYKTPRHGSKPAAGAVATIKNIEAKQLIPAIFDYIIYKKILADITLNNIIVNPIKAGFLKIPRLNFKRINIELNIENNRKMYGTADFTGDLKGNLKIKNSIIKPVLRINSGYFTVKPDDMIYNKFSILFKTMFKKNKNGYFVYNIRNLILD